MSENCMKCCFFIEDGCGHLGECRRNPPQLNGLKGCWPLVEISGWCGEWSANDAERRRQYNASMAGDF